MKQKNQGFTHQNFPSKISGGFTLIELLMVVAIIGLLASVVLAMLNSARARGIDAAIKEDLVNMRAQAALYYDNAGGNTYGTTSGLIPVTGSYACTPSPTTLLGDTTFCNGLKQSASLSGSTLYYNAFTTSWVAGVALKQSPSAWHCVDNSGSSKTEITSTIDILTGIQSTTTVCP